MNQSILKITIVIIILCVSITSCSPAKILSSPATPTPMNTSTPSPTPAPTITPTPTPMPVNLASALDQGMLSEIEFFGNGKVQDSVFSPDGSIYIAILYRGIHVFNTAVWKEITILPLSPGICVTSAVFSVDGTIFAAGDSAGKVTFWDTKNWEVVQEIIANDGDITSLDIAPDNQRFVTIGNNNVISIWNFSDGTLINSQIRSRDMGPANYSTDGALIFISEATMYSDLTIWTASDLQLIDRVNQLGRTAPNHAVSPFSNVVASYGFSDLYIYDYETKITIKLENLFGPMEGLTHLIFLNESNLILKGEYSDFYYLVNIKNKGISKISTETFFQKSSKNPEFTKLTKGEEIQSLGFISFSKIRGITLDGKSLILEDGILDLARSEMVPQPKECEFDWKNARMLADGDIASTSAKSWSSKQEGKGIFLINKIDHKELHKCSTVSFDYDLESAVQTTALSADGSLLAAGTIFGKLHIWNVNSKEKIGEIQAHNMQSVFGHKGAFSNIVFSDDNLRIVTQGWDGTMKVWSLYDLSQLDMVYGYSPTFSPDGKFFVYTLRDDRIQIKSLEEDEYPLTLESGYTNVSDLHFIPDTDLLISGGSPGSVKIWSISEQKSIAEYPQYHRVSSMVVDSTGTRLYIHTYDGVISVWGYVPNN